MPIAQESKEDLEKDPEEDSKEDNTSHSTPLSSIPPIGGGARTVRTARKRVAIPNRQWWTRSPEPSTPTTDPYVHPADGFQSWRRTLHTLQEWRSAGRYSSIPEGGEPSAVRQEFLLDTTPIIVDRMVSQENRIDLMEDALMEMPGSETIGELQDQVNNAEQRISGIYDTVQDLKERLEATTWKFKNIETTIERMEVEKAMPLREAKGP